MLSASQFLCTWTARRELAKRDQDKHLAPHAAIIEEFIHKFVVQYIAHAEGGVG